MSTSYMWCNACGHTHESREECPKGWVRSYWQMAYVPKEQNEKEQNEILDFNNWFNNEIKKQ